MTENEKTDTVKRERSDKMIEWIEKNRSEINAAEKGSVEFNFISRTLTVKKEDYVKVV